MNWIPSPFARRTVAVWAALVVALVTVWTPVPLRAAQLENIDVRFEGGVYHASAEVLLNTSRDHVLEILTDYDRLKRLNTEILESNVVEWKNRRTAVVHIKLKTCLFVFCFSTTTLQSFEVRDDEILVTIFPKEGEFRSGWVRWRLIPDGDRTRLSYQTDLVPDFWVPPFIGPYIIKAKLHDNSLETFNMLEKIASIRWPSATRDAPP